MFIRFLAISLLTLLFVSCGGGSSSSSDPESFTLNGIYTAGGPVKGALVWAQKSTTQKSATQGTALSVPVRTDKNGKFTIKLPYKYKGKNITLAARGGLIDEFGVDLQNTVIELVNFKPKGSVGLTISKAFGFDGKDSKFNLSLAVAISTLGKDKISQIKTAFSNSNDIKQALQSLKENATADQNASLELAKSISDSFESYKKNSVGFKLAKYLKSIVDDKSVFENNTSLDNKILELSQAVLNVNGKIIPQTRGAINVARLLASKDVLTLTNLGKTDANLSVGDLGLDKLSKLNVIDVTLPLADNELLDTEDKKRAYFLQSNLSPYMQIDKILADVIDSNVLDEIFVENVKGLSQNGNIEEAKITADLKISTPANQARAYLAIATSLVGLDKTDDALSWTDKAYSKFDKNLKATGATPNEADVKFYANVADNYLKLSKNDKASEALESIGGLAQQNDTYVDKAYITFVDTLAKIAKQNIKDKASKEQIKTSIDTLYSYVKKMKKSQSNVTPGTDYKNWIFCDKTKKTIEVANLYKEAGETAKTKEVIADFEVLARNNDNNSTRTIYKTIAPTYVFLDLETQLRNLMKERKIPAINEKDVNASIVSYKIVNEILKDDTKAQEKIDEYYKNAKDEMTAIYGLTMDFKFEPGIAKILEQKNRKDLAMLAYKKVLAIANNDLNDTFIYRSIVNQVRVEKSIVYLAKFYKDIGADDANKQEVEACLDKYVAQLEDSNCSNDKACSKSIKGNIYPVLAIGYKHLGKHQKSANCVKKGVENFTKYSWMMGFPKLVATGSYKAVLDTSDTLKDNSDTQTYFFRNLVAKNLFIGKDYFTLLSLGDQIKSEAKLDGFSIEHKDLLKRAKNITKEIALQDIEKNATSDYQYLFWMDILVKTGNLDLAIKYHNKNSDFDGGKPTNVEKNKRLKAIAKALYSYDDFPNGILDGLHPGYHGVALMLYSLKDFPKRSIATFDLDSDGKPDFFSSTATQAQKDASNLTLDDDIDGDGTPDANDHYPFYKDKQ